MEIKNTLIFAKEIRKIALKLVYQAKASHIGGALSMADILAVLYHEILQINPSEPKHPQRDRFILSKGHACSSLYATLALKEFFPLSDLESYGLDGSQFLSHTTHYISGVEVSSGSLGHGLPIACGMALAAKRKNENWRTYCLVGDGEMDEGSNWESILFASHYKLDNLCLIIDYNKIQSLGFTNEVLNLEPLNNKFISFNWNVIEINGHNHDKIKEAFIKALQIKNIPTVIIAHTIKGKGVDFMENDLLWHYRNPNKEQYITALERLEL